MTVFGGKVVAAVVAGLIGCGVLGCANPGPPRAPSLYVPAMARGLSAERAGDAVVVRFTAPLRSTDNVALRDATVAGRLCREVAKVGSEGAKQGCVTVKTAQVEVGTPVVWSDVLPPSLAQGKPRVLGYRVEFFSATGRPGETTDAVYVASGGTPPAVAGLQVSGSRGGNVVTWRPEAQGEVLLRREDVAATAKPAKNSGKKNEENERGVVWMAAGGAGAERVLDDSAQLDTMYRYMAVRRVTVELGGRMLEVRSAESAPVEAVLREVYPPAAPTGLHAAAYEGGVDLIWQPVADAKLAGYAVYRETGGVWKKVGAAAVPGFHDGVTGERYRVTAVDAKGNESAGVEVGVR